MDLSIIPRISEKTVSMANQGVFTFDTPTTANKQQIADAVAKQFGVHVVGIKTTIAKGKVVRRYSRGKQITGQRVDRKKAYVTLAEGEKIAAFEQEAK